MNQPIISNEILNDDAWRLAESTTNFIAFEPDNRTDLSQRTKFKIVCDAKSLVVRVRCYDLKVENIVKGLFCSGKFADDWIDVGIASMGQTDCFCVHYDS